MASVFDKYYQELGVDAQATMSEIKSAYRKKAKFYHPDRNSSEDADERFIAINEAYEILINKEKYAWRIMQATFNKEAVARKKHEDILIRAREEARQRAREHAEMRYKSFTRSRIYKTAMMVNTAYDYIFIFVGIGMIATPFIAYYFFPQIDQYGREVNDFSFGPIIIGIAFLIGIWHFIFKARFNSDDSTFS